MRKRTIVIHSTPPHILPRPTADERTTEHNKGRENKRHHDILYPTRTNKQIRYFFLIAAISHHSRNFWKKYTAYRRGKHHKHLRKLNRHGIYRHCHGSSIHSQNKLPRAPINPIYYRIKEYPETIDRNFFKKSRIEMPKTYLDIQLISAIIKLIIKL